MGLLTRDAPAKSTRSAVTIIAQGNKFSGEMSIVGKMHIDGVFEGNISSLDSISIGKRGEVRGIIRALHINVCGLLEGEIHCDELTVEDGGKVRGTVYSDQLVVERKGCFVGERHLKADASKSDASKPEDSKADAEAPASSRSPMLTRALEDLPGKVTLMPAGAADREDTESR